MFVPLDEPLRPRWLLRDKNGALVPALIEPHCGDPFDCRLPDLGASPQFRCVHVKVFKDQYIGLLYGLADGSPLTCAHDANALTPFTSCSSQPGCNGPFFAYGETDGRVRPDAPRTTHLHEGKLLYASTSKPPVELQCFTHDVIDGCVQAELAFPAFPLLPVPDDILNLLADGAPYTLEVAYD